MTLEQLVEYAKDYAKSHGEPDVISGKQEKFETIVALYAK